MKPFVIYLRNICGIAGHREGTGRNGNIKEKKEFKMENCKNAAVWMAVPVSASFFEYDLHCVFHDKQPN
jgi:hypothetical protein